VTVITRFAPSPTGNLHVGNVRTAIINWLYAKKASGQFILRFDDTDTERSKQQYINSIEKDLKWLGLNWDLSFRQSSRIDRYREVQKFLIDKKRLYPCFETTTELELKRKSKLSMGLPPIYDRAALSLSKEQIETYLNQGRKPHFRFLIQDGEISWQDMIKGELKYQASNLSDPIVIREDGGMTYMICSVIDDIDFNVTHIIRGEDHVSNSAIQLQMFEALEKNSPKLAHLSLVKASANQKISKRDGGFEVSSLREEMFEQMTVNSFFSMIGSSVPISICEELDSLIDKFDISKLSRSPTTYFPEELETVNHKLLINLSLEKIKERLVELGISDISEDFWLAVRPNLRKLPEIRDWYEIIYKPRKANGLDKELLQIAANLLPQEISFETWKMWTNEISLKTNIRGRALFVMLRLALTGMDHGPELKYLLPLIQREEIIKRLTTTEVN
jgi:glutamyl-tRNA synthetase